MPPIPPTKKISPNWSRAVVAALSFGDSEALLRAHARAPTDAPEWLRAEGTGALCVALQSAIPWATRALLESGVPLSFAALQSFRTAVPRHGSPAVNVAHDVERTETFRRQCEETWAVLAPYAKAQPTLVRQAYVELLTCWTGDKPFPWIGPREYAQVGADVLASLMPHDDPAIAALCSNEGLDEVTPLALAWRQGSPRNAQQLCELGADVWFRDRNGWSLAAVLGLDARAPSQTLDTQSELDLELERDGGAPAWQQLAARMHGQRLSRAFSSQTPVPRPRM